MKKKKIAELIHWWHEKEKFNQQVVEKNQENPRNSKSIDSIKNAPRVSAINLKKRNPKIRQSVRIQFQIISWLRKKYENRRKIFQNLLFDRWIKKKKKYKREILQLISLNFVNGSPEIKCENWQPILRNNRKTLRSVAKKVKYVDV